MIVISIDGLSAMMPGVYGNTSIETPSIDAMATTAMTFDFAFANSSDLATSLRAMMSATGKQPDNEVADGRTVFVSDCETAIACATEAEFETIIQAKVTIASQPADEIAETRAAQFFSTAIAEIESVTAGDLIWLHYSGLSQQWTSPVGLRETFAGPDDPTPWSLVQAPNFPFDPEIDDPDSLVAVQHAMFAEVTVVDRMLGLFLDSINEHPVAANATIVLTSPRGFSTGSSNRVGVGESLQGDSVHVPLIVRQGGDGTQAEFVNRRSHALVDNAQVGQLIADGNSAVHIAQWLRERDREFITGDADPCFLKRETQTAVVTDAWKLIETTVSQPPSSRVQLFARPDDRWEVNDVSTRCPSVVEELKRLLADESHPV